MARDYQGDAKCDCGRDVPVYLTGGGMLTTSCGWCRVQMHCPTGSASFRDLKARIKGATESKETIVTPKNTLEKRPVRLAPIDRPAPVAQAPKIEAPPVIAPKEKTIFDIFNKG